MFEDANLRGTSKAAPASVHVAIRDSPFKVRMPTAAAATILPRKSDFDVFKDILFAGKGEGAASAGTAAAAAAAAAAPAAPVSTPAQIDATAADTGAAANRAAAATAANAAATSAKEATKVAAAAVKKGVFSFGKAVASRFKKADAPDALGEGGGAAS
eukprot:Tamp_29949.p2 GENE.Tamp_29949~~Tamp_29949.p2  ORF type:complete len:158 (+),score=51.92 Tamp_29949:124-597(+)